MRRRRLFLALAAVWDLGVGLVAVAQPEGRIAQSRRNGIVVLVFAALYAALAVRPWRPLIVTSAAAKVVGGTSGAVALTQGKRDVITWLSLADAVWLPGFIAASRR